MEILRIVVTVLFALDALALAIIVMMQESKATGLLRCNQWYGRYLLGQQ